MKIEERMRIDQPVIITFRFGLINKHRKLECAQKAELKTFAERRILLFRWLQCLKRDFQEHYNMTWDGFYCCYCLTFTIVYLFINLPLIINTKRLLSVFDLARFSLNTEFTWKRRNGPNRFGYTLRPTYKHTHTMAMDVLVLGKHNLLIVLFYMHRVNIFVCLST